MLNHTNSKNAEIKSLYEQLLRRGVWLVETQIQFKQLNDILLILNSYSRVKKKISVTDLSNGNRHDKNS